MSTRSLDVRAAALQSSALFSGLLLAECGEIVSLARERYFAKRQTIFRQGDPAKFIFVLVSGRVKITETSHSGVEVILSIEEAGEVIGELGAMPDASRTRTAQALERSHMLMWEAGEFQTLLERYPALVLNSTHILSERLRVLEERFQELATEPVAPRLARTLVRLLEPDENGTRKPAPISLSREELAQMTGMTSFTVSRLLCDWEQRGIISNHRRSVLIKDLPGLRTLASGTA
ncbi:MAG TPA: Crp/Fnr family transcriptional regulator [Terriglobales bacterium]|nr:Crp/Fnr family transcriptional regulator [Terriglobales bacterium]